MSDGSQVLSKDLLWQDYYANLKTALSSMRKVFRLRAADGMTQDHIAARLGIDKSLVSRRFNGEENHTLKTLSFMASGMNCRLNIQFRPYEELGEGNNYVLEPSPSDPQGINIPVKDNQPQLGALQAA